MAQDVAHFPHLSAVCASSFEDLHSITPHLRIEWFGFFFFSLSTSWVLYMFWLLMPHQMPDYSGFLCLHSAVSFVVQGLFNFTQTPINYCCYFLGSFSESPCLSHDLKVFPSSSRNSGLTVRPLTQFELISLCIDICVDLVSSLYMRETQFSTQHLLKRGSPLWKSRCWSWVDFHSVPSVYMSALALFGGSVLFVTPNTSSL